MIRKRIQTHCGMTLIELLICVAIVSVIVVSTANIFFYSFREQALVREELFLQQSVNISIQSMAADSAAAFSSRIEDEGRRWILNSSADGKERVVYQFEPGRGLSRIVNKDRRSHSQLMADHVREFAVSEEAGLVSVKLILTKEKYNREFIRECETSFYMGGIE